MKVLLFKSNRFITVEAHNSGWLFSIDSRENGDEIESVYDYTSAVELLKKFEDSDMSEGFYEENFYEIVAFNFKTNEEVQDELDFETVGIPQELLW